MSTRRQLWLLLPVLLTIALTALAGRGARDSRGAVSEADARKADMIWLEALNQRLEGASDAYTALVERAWELNPKDLFLGSEYGFELVRRGAMWRDSTTIARGLEMMRAYAESPEGLDDYYTQATIASFYDQFGDPEYALAVMKRTYENNPDRPEIGLAYSDRLAQTDDPASLATALALLDTLEIREGASELLTGRRLSIHAQQEDTLALFADVRRQMIALPNSPEAAIMAGEIYSNFGKPDSALLFYDRAIEIDPTNGMAYYARANHYLTRGDSVGYAREIMKSLEQPDLDMETISELIRDYVARFYRDSDKHAELDRLFEKMLSLHPHEALLHGMYAEYLGATGRVADAAEQIEYQLDLDPASDDTRWNLLVASYMAAEDTSAAIAAAKRGLRFFPDNDDLPIQLSAAYSLSEHSDSAIAILRPLVDKASDPVRRSDLLTAIGDAYYAADMADSAFTYYDRAIEINPTNLLAMNNCAYFLACSDRDLDRALELIEKVMERKSDDPTSLDTYAWVLFKRGDYEKALEIIDRTMELEDDLSSDLLEHAGDIYFMNRRHKEAVEFWKRALELDPDNELLGRKVANKTYFYE